MRHIQVFEEFHTKDKINEDLLALLPSLSLLGFGIGMLITGTDVPALVKSDWNSYWADRKINKIILRLKDDDDIKAFFAQPTSRQQSGWKALLKSKLSDEEIQYMSILNKKKFG